MENLTMYVPIMAMSTLKYGNAIKTMRILESIKGYDVDWNIASDLLKDVTLFNKCKTNDSYSKKVLKQALKKDDVKVRTLFENTSSLDFLSKQLRYFMISDSELTFLINLYKRFIDEATLNVLDYSEMFDISFNLSEEIVLSQISGNTEVEKLRRLVEVMNTFWRYHQFFAIATAISIGIEKGEKIINFSFMDELSHMKDIQNDEWS